jgi:diguanylate cyclase (GGDEF)-like protein
MRLAHQLARQMNARALALGLLIGLAGAAINLAVHPLATLDGSVQDVVLAHRTPESYLGAAADTSRDPRSFITIVAIDERTLAELGAYNGGYPRAYHAQVIENLLAAPPRVIALDLGFFEPTPDDGVLAAALDHARSLPVPTAVILSAAGLPQASASADSELVFERGLEPVPQLAQRASTAFANVVPDERGTIRGMPLVAYLDGTERPSLGLASVAAYLRRPTFVDGRASDSLRLAGRTIPVDAGRFMRINFFGPPSSAYSEAGTFRVISFVDVLRGRVDPSAWRGGLVFVGALGATGLADDYWTPTSDQGRKMAGVEIHANAAATLFSTDFLRVAPPLTQAAVFVGVALVMALLAASVSIVAAFGVGPLVLLALAAANVWALYALGLIVPLAAPLLFGLLAFVGVLLPRVAGEQRQGRAAREALAAEQLQDRLTGLGNRAQLVLAMQRSIGDMRPSSAGFALLFVDMDRFKDVNDALGHAVGDHLLQEVATRLRQSLSEASCVARLGGDEFAALLPEADSQHAAAACIGVLRSLELPVMVDGRPLSVGASIGIAVYPDDGADPETLLRHADAGMYAAKQAHCGYARHSPDQEHATAERLEMVSALRRAIADDELGLQYQPKVDCRTGRVSGAEALVRWHTPTHGLIAPDRFIPLAEQTGLIGPLTRWVLLTAVRQIRAWLDEGRTLKIAVNLSPYDLQDSRLPAHVFDVLERYDVSPELLSLEITEGALLGEPSRALAVLNELAEGGVVAALDDFGTGYSSLTYLRQLPLDELKIDASFVRGMVEAERDRAIVSSTIELGHRLGLSVIAEGVEDATTLELLTALGCDQAQGFYISRAVDPEALCEWMRLTETVESRSADAA